METLFQVTWQDVGATKLFLDPIKIPNKTRGNSTYTLLPLSPTGWDFIEIVGCCLKTLQELYHVQNTPQCKQKTYRTHSTYRNAAHDYVTLFTLQATACQTKQKTFLLDSYLMYLCITNQTQDTFICPESDIQCTSDRLQSKQSEIHIAVRSQSSKIRWKQWTKQAFFFIFLYIFHFQLQCGKTTKKNQISARASIPAVWMESLWIKVSTKCLWVVVTDCPDASIYYCESSFPKHFHAWLPEWFSGASRPRPQVSQLSCYTVPFKPPGAFTAHNHEIR